MTPDYDRAIAYARERGAQDGHAAASWTYYGNTPRDWYARTLRGIEDGDPAVLDALPAPDLSGQYADTTTGPSLTLDALEAAGHRGRPSTAPPMATAATRTGPARLPTPTNSRTRRP